MMQQLDQIITGQILLLAKRRLWKETRKNESSIVAFRDYIADNLYIRISNDRGCFDMEIGSLGGNDLRCVSFYKDLLTPSAQGHWHLSIEQQCEFLEQHWAWLNENLHNENATRTVQKLDENARSRK